MKNSSSKISYLNKTVEILNNSQHNWLSQHILFSHLGGSILYGTSNENSDVDLRGVYIPPKRFWLGTDTSIRIHLIRDNYDLVLFDIREFINLVYAGHPYVMETLFASGEDPLGGWNEVKQKCMDLLSQRIRNGYSSKINWMKNISSRIENESELKKTRYTMYRMAFQAKELLTNGMLSFPIMNNEKVIEMRNNSSYIENIDQIKKEIFTCESKLPPTVDPSLRHHISEYTFYHFVKDSDY